MKNMTLEHITEVCGGTYFGPEEKKTAEVADIVTDSRKAGEGSLFVAIPAGGSGGKTAAFSLLY